MQPARATHRATATMRSPWILLLLCEPGSAMLCDAIAPSLRASSALPISAAQCLRGRAALRVVMQVGGFPDDDDRSNDGDDEELKEAPPEEFSDSSEESADIEDFRAQMMRQFLGGDSGSSQPNPVDRLLGIKDPTAPTVTRASTLAAGQVLVANPERFCSRNPFSRPVKDLGRFGLQGPIDDDELPPDMKAQMLPVLVLIEHGSGGSRALLMERRTGALMGDVSMDDYGCVAINPLWLGGSSWRLRHVPRSVGDAGASARGRRFLGYAVRACPLERKLWTISCAAEKTNNAVDPAVGPLLA